MRPLRSAASPTPSNRLSKSACWNWRTSSRRTMRRTTRRCSSPSARSSTYCGRTGRSGRLAPLQLFAQHLQLQPALLALGVRLLRFGELLRQRGEFLRVAAVKIGRRQLRLQIGDLGVEGGAAAGRGLASDDLTAAFGSPTVLASTPLPRWASMSV